MTCRTQQRRDGHPLLRIGQGDYSRDITPNPSFFSVRSAALWIAAMTVVIVAVWFLASIARADLPAFVVTVIVALVSFAVGRRSAIT